MQRSALNASIQVSIYAPQAAAASSEERGLGRRSRAYPSSPIPCRGMPDATKAAVARGNFRLKHGARGLAEQQIGVADDAGADRGETVAAARAHRRRAIGEFNFAKGAQRFRPAGSIHRAGLDIDGCDHIVSGPNVGGQLFDQITLATAIPQMMMRIDDRPRGIE